jgi:hypothetical protein
MGNEREVGSPPSYPAAIPGVIAVGATSILDRVTRFSNRGEHISLSAPGQTIWPEVGAANFLKREANNPEVRRIAFAEVPDERNLMEVLNRLQSLPVVATANLPAQSALIELAWKVVE